MSEREPQPNPEKAPAHSERGPEVHRPHHDHKEAQPSAKERAEKLADIREEVDEEAKSAGDIKLDQTSEGKNQSTPPVGRELKNQMKVRTLSRIRKELPAPQRVLSKVVHAKPVEAVSAVSEKTIARPIGLLGGGFAALVGSLITFYMAKHYGFRYNLLLFLMLFVAGYAIATVLEMLVLLARRLSK